MIKNIIKGLQITNLIICKKQLFSKIVVLKNVAVFTRKSMCWSLILIKLSLFLIKSLFRPTVLLKRDSSTGVSLWIFWNFYKQFFYRTPLMAASSDYRWSPTILIESKTTHLIRSWLMNKCQIKQLKIKVKQD